MEGSQLKLVRVNAKYKSSGTNNNFNIQFAVRDLDQVKAIAVVRASLNRSFPNIYAPINVLVLQPNLLSPVVITVPPGQYTAVQLAAAIQTASGGTLTVTYQVAPVDRFQFTYLGPAASAALLVPDSTIGDYIGLTTTLILPAIGIPVNVDSSPQLEGPSNVYIQSQLMCGSHCIDVASNGSYIPFLAAIDYSQVPFGYNGSFESKTPNWLQVKYLRNSGVRALMSFDVQITDPYGNLLPIQPNTYLDMHLAFMY
jgi:hypothetical protein